LLGLLILVVSIAVGDSLNPSTVAPALYLATTEHPRRQVGGFTAGVFAVNLLAGLLIMLGPGQWLLSLIPRPNAATKHIIELLAGTIILVLAAGLWFGRRTFARSKLPTVETKGGPGLALGAGIGAIELPTALPYFAAIAAITDSGFSISVRVAMLVAYNVVFVLPLVSILIAVEVLGDNSRRVLGRANQWLQAHWPVLLAGLGLIVGIVILALGLVGLSTDPPRP
jgi:cytochrome c biogenesis protein CcdA